MQANWGIKICTRIFFGMGPTCLNTSHRFIIKIFWLEYFRIFYSANWTCHKVANSLIAIKAASMAHSKPISRSSYGTIIWVGIKNHSTCCELYEKTHIYNFVVGSGSWSLWSEISPLNLELNAPLHFIPVNTCGLPCHLQNLEHTEYGQRVCTQSVLIPRNFTTMVPLRYDYDSQSVGAPCRVVNYLSIYMLWIKKRNEWHGWGDVSGSVYTTDL